MGSHPINLGLRFLLELVALITAGMWGWNQGNDFLRYVYAAGFPILLAAMWGAFNVLNDPSRSGKAPVQVAGWIRLILELAFFSFACWALYDMKYQTIYQVFGAIVLIHYILSYDRIIWLLKQS
jgi:hypothetical protein